MRSGCVDSSALVAILLGETDAAALTLRIGSFRRLIVAAPNLVESRIALSRRYGRDAKPEIDRLLRRFDVTIVPFTSLHAEVAHDAYLRYGKGRDPAALNFGDCMAYAAAKVARAELIYVGDDFAQTDLA